MVDSLYFNLFHCIPLSCCFLQPNNSTNSNNPDPFKASQPASQKDPGPCCPFAFLLPKNLANSTSKNYYATRYSEPVPNILNV